MFFIADVVEAFEALETGLDSAQNDRSLDPVVCLGANWAIFILGKYYAKLNNCEIYPIALSECILVFYTNIFTSRALHSALDPRKTAKWIKKNKGWQPERKTAALEKVQHHWNESYKPLHQQGLVLLFQHFLLSLNQPMYVLSEFTRTHFIDWFNYSHI